MWMATSVFFSFFFLIFLTSNNLIHNQFKKFKNKFTFRSQERIKIKKKKKKKMMNYYKLWLIENKFKFIFHE